MADALIMFFIFHSNKNQKNFYTYQKNSRFVKVFPLMRTMIFGIFMFPFLKKKTLYNKNVMSNFLAPLMFDSIMTFLTFITSNFLSRIKLGFICLQKLIVSLRKESSNRQAIMDFSFFS